MSVANVVTQKSRLPSRLRPRGMDDAFLITLAEDRMRFLDEALEWC
jgi:hypothetical protein